MLEVRIISEHVGTWFVEGLRSAPHFKNNPPILGNPLISKKCSTPPEHYQGKILAQMAQTCKERYHSSVPKSLVNESPASSQISSI